MQPPPPKVDVETQGRVYRLRYRSNQPPACVGLSKRGVIRDFSPSSRRRLIDMFNRFGVDGQRPVFLTLTYGQSYPGPTEAKRHLSTFFKRVRRRWPLASAVWRLEMQRRGAPHFHLIFFGLPFWPRRNIARTWRQVIGLRYLDRSRPTRPRAPFTRVEMIYGIRRVLGYVSKYVAKMNARAGAGGFNIVTYLTADGLYRHPQTGEVEHIGRWWGVHNRAALPYAPRRVASILAKHTGWYNVRRLAHKLMGYRGRHIRRDQGITLYTDSASRWWRYLAQQLGEPIISGGYT